MQNRSKDLLYNMIKLALTCLCSFLLSSADAQQNLVDSITKELQHPMADTNRALSMMRLAIDYELVDTAKAFKAYRDAIKFAREKNLYYNLGRIYQNQSVLLSNTGMMNKPEQASIQQLFSIVSQTIQKLKNMRLTPIAIWPTG
ncbi:MAG: hypothetical protein IPP43_02610 [Chitinophagaceae bacterium]|nr:hypothetical protein [Chitinophagaceae bacterium]